LTPFNPFFIFIDTLLALPGLDIDLVLDTSLNEALSPCMLSWLAVFSRRVSMVSGLVWIGFSRFATSVTSLYIVWCKCPFTRHPAATLSKRAGN
jgi:hypothetical protein